MNSPRPPHKPAISLLHATRGRPDLALAARDKWLRAAAHPEQVEHIFAVDCDDQPTQLAVAGLLHRVVPQKGGGCVAAWNLAAEASSGDILVQLSDDWAPVQRWDDEFARRLRDVSQPAVLRPSDGHRRDDLLCMAIITRARLVQQGEFLHHGYFGVFSDDEFSFRAYLDGVVIDARDLVLTHHHPHYDSSVSLDETYANQNNSERSRSGRDLFLQRNPQAMGHWLHSNTWERFFVPLSASIPDLAPEKQPAPASAPPCAAIPSPSQQKALQMAEDLFLNKRDHVEMFRATAMQAKELLEGIKTSLRGKLVLRGGHLLPFRKCLDGAKLRLKKRSMLNACSSYLQATRIGLDLLNEAGGHFMVKSRALSTSIRHLRAQYRRQRNWLRKVKPWMDHFPGARADATWGLDPAYYAQQAGMYFSDVVKAARHYDKKGWHAGLNPHSLFDGKYFQSQNAAQIDPKANPLEEYHRLLDEGGAPAAHPKFPGAWLREFFSHSYDQTLRPQQTPIPDPPVNVEAARTFVALKPNVVVGTVLSHTSEPELRRLVLSFLTASLRAVEAGHQKPQLLMAGRSEEWNAESIKQLSESTGVELRLVPLSPQANFGAAHNELMRVAFDDKSVTHYLSLLPGSTLHPDSLLELLKAIESSNLPALLEGRQFPHENPKEYDAESLLTNWCSSKCLLMPRFLFELTGGFDDDFVMDGADVDLGWRTWQKGYGCQTVPTALIHCPTPLSADDPQIEKLKLEAGRILGEKWKTPRFRLECERNLVERGHYRAVQELPLIRPTIQNTPHQRVDFEHDLAFSQTRW